MNDIEKYVEFLLEQGSSTNLVEDRQTYIKIAKLILDLSCKRYTSPLTINWPQVFDPQKPTYPDNSGTPYYPVSPIVTCLNTSSSKE